MDIQMPEMDGFEATRLIRAAEAARGTERVPIVAPTAQALAEDHALCVAAAGMGDHLAKPLRRQDPLGRTGAVGQRGMRPPAGCTRGAGGRTSAG